jgi:PhnB protein
MTAASSPNRIPDRYRRITPALVVQDADKALKFSAELFGATERMRCPEMMRRMSAIYGEG